MAFLFAENAFLTTASRTTYVLAGIGLLGVCLWMLWPGLYGNFYLDDFPNLSPLENAGKNGTPLFSYLLNPAVSGLGRPFAYLTFLLQQEHWPDDPFYFKLANLSIHALNGILVFCIALLSIRLTLRDQLSESFAYAIAISASLIWVVLPVHASAIFYVIQRMTLLSAFFTLAGIAGYLWVRLSHTTWTKKQYVLAGFFVCLGYAGVLAKENSIQTGILIWAFELTILSRLPWRPSKWFQGAFFLVPLCVLIIYLFTFNDVLSGYSHRDFTLKERLLTQAVIFWEYIAKVFVPTPSRLHLFNDGGTIYNRIWGNYAVIASLSGLVIGIVSSFLLRKRRPWLSFAFLFFCFGHFLESTFIPLEMNFEHRNYLPAVGAVIGVLVALVLGLKFIDLSQNKRRLGLGLISVWIVFISLVSVLESRTWGNSKSFALSALVDRPNSYRARQEAAAFFLGNGEYLTAANLLYSIDVDFDVYAGTYAQLLLLRCYDDRIPLPVESEINSIFRTAPVDLGAEMALHDLWRIKRQDNDECGHITWNQFLSYIDNLLENDNFSRSLNLKLLASFINADKRNYEVAIDILEDLPESQKSFAVRILIARFYIMAEQPDQALKAINDLLGSEASIDKLVYESYLNKLKSDIEKDSDS